MLVAEQGLLSARSGSPREEQARQAARARTRDLEFAWASFLSRAMQQGAIPKNDPRLLTRAILGLYNSIWHWYRPNGIVALNRVAEFFTDRSLAMIGVGPEALERAEGRGVSFFERYFAALDGPDPYTSLELVAEDVEFTIQWARGTDRRQPPVRRRAGRAARVHRRRRHDAAGRITCCSPAAAATSSSRSARRAATAASGSGPSSPWRSSTATGGCMRYMVARSPAIAFEPAPIDAA